MSKNYSQLRASIAVARASLLAILRSPTSVVFSLLFPIIFILVFGEMIDTGGLSIKVGIASQCDTSCMMYKAIMSVKNIKPQTGLDEGSMTDALQKGKITAILNIKSDAGVFLIPHYEVELTTSNSSAIKLPLLQSIVKQSLDGLNEKIFPKNFSAAKITITKIPGRTYKIIDFILPGQLGFSLLMAGVFGSSFLFFSLRQTLVLKRFFATPIKRTYLIFGEFLSRLFFQAIAFIIMILLGYFVFRFTLVNGIFTFLEMFLFSVFGLIIFMGIGFIVSSVIEDESSIAPVANTITLPQILLCGLFFPIDSYPAWLQTFCNILPLTYLVEGLRKIAFEGTHFWQMPTQLIGLCCWTIIVSFMAIKVFKWE
ncbi:MAG TPA: ABC transporter permease [Puia sp.]|nr:ABC transporter permease [Puia sp.]